MPVAEETAVDVVRTLPGRRGLFAGSEWRSDVTRGLEPDGTVDASAVGPPSCIRHTVKKSRRRLQVPEFGPSRADWKIS